MLYGSLADRTHREKENAGGVKGGWGQTHDVYVEPFFSYNGSNKTKQNKKRRITSSVIARTAHSCTLSFMLRLSPLPYHDTVLHFGGCCRPCRVTLELKNFECKHGTQRVLTIFLFSWMISVSLIYVYFSFSEASQLGRVHVSGIISPRRDVPCI